MDKVPCSKCGTDILPMTLERTGGFCMPCSSGKKKRSLYDRLSDFVNKHSNDPWHTNLPNAKNFEELQALTTPRQECDCCEYLTLSEKGIGERCGACAWVDQAFSEQDLNDGLTLKEAKKSFAKIGACHERYFMKVRMARYSEKVREEDRPENQETAVDERPSQVEEASIEKEKFVWNAYERIMHSIHNGEAVSDNERIVHDVLQLLSELNSGESFEHYLRWANESSILKVMQKMRTLGLDEAADIVQAAIAIVFPTGFPSDADEFEEIIDDLSDHQRNQLEQHFKMFSRFEGLIVNKLAPYTG